MTKVVREVHHMIPNGHSLDYIPYTLGVPSSSTSSTQPNNSAHMSESGSYIYLFSYLFFNKNYFFELFILIKLHLKIIIRTEGFIFNI